MKNQLLLITLISVLIINIENLKCQGVAINTTGANADPSAMLDISSSVAGILIPRMLESQKNSISNPATGLMIYQTDGASGFWYFNGTVWTQVSGSTVIPSSCPPANAGETLINYNGCMYVKNVDEATTYNWDNAKIQCTSLGSGWYLPNLLEIEVIYNNWNQPLGDCQGGPCPLTGLYPNYYWSSSVANPTSAWMLDFTGGYRHSSSKLGILWVRCVRR